MTVSDKLLQPLLKRLEQLEAEQQVRFCMNRYMRLCDTLDEKTDLDELLGLFTDDAIWEGIGALYSQRLGRHEGAAAIRDMFAKYTQPPAHFLFNLHVLGNELITVNGSAATGSWVLLQPSDFVDGRSHITSARITATFRCDKGVWKMSHFQTENLFSRAMLKPWSEAANLPVPD